MKYITIISFYLLVIFILNLIGSVLETKKKNLNFKNINYSTSIYGFSLVILIENFLFFSLKISAIFVAYYLSALSILITFYLFKNNKVKNFIYSYVISTLVGIPIFIFIIIFYYLYGENLIIFRGNQWDFFFYLYQSLIVFNNDFTHLISNPNKIYGLLENSEYVTIGKYLHDRPSTYLNIALVKILSQLDILKSAYLYKAICISLTANGFISIINNHKKKILLGILFPFSFWVFYIYEIDALAQLASVPILLVLTNLTINLFIREKIENQDIFKIAITSSALFLIYPESFFIYLLLFIVFFLLNNKRFFFSFKKINTSHFKIIFLFIILTASGFSSTYGQIFNKIYSNISGNHNVNYWGYYGAFILGKDSIVSNSYIVNNLKQISEFGYDFDIFKKILMLNYQSGYVLFFLNIIPSFFGLFIITVGKLTNSLFFLINLIIIIITNVYLIISFVKYNKYFVNISNNYKTLLKSVLICFIFLFIIFFFNKSYWQIIKLYFFFSPFLYLLIILNKQKINYLLILIICLTPFYQYSEYNNGIGRKNSFPSIINSDHKNNFNWAFNVNELTDCSLIKIKINPTRYNAHKYIYAAIKVYDNQEILFKEKNANKNCYITENGNKFIIFKS